MFLYVVHPRLKYRMIVALLLVPLKLLVVDIGESIVMEFLLVLN